MKKFLIFILVFMSVNCLSKAMESIKKGDIYKSFLIDLNKDGKKEKIQIKVFSINDTGWYGSINVYDSSSELIWSGPENDKTIDPYVFGSWDYGSSIPELIGDIDSDGNIELVAPEPVSDVRPVKFKIFRWDQKAFRFLFCKSLVENPRSSAKYPWCETMQYSGRWISEFKKLVKKGECLVNITECSKDGVTKNGIADILSDSEGYHINFWTRNMK